jgi:hypothetical protein
MKKVIMLVGILSASAIGATAQNQNCRDIAAGGFIQPDEVIVQTQSGYVACRVTKVTTVVNSAVPAPAPAPTANPIIPAKAPLSAQPTYNGNNNYQEREAPLVQVATGYQYNSINLSGYGGSTNRLNTNGMFAQVMMNFNRYVSAVGNVDVSYKSYQGSNYLLTYMGGVQAYPLSHGRWSPFGRFMLGAGTLHVSGAGSATAFDWQVGGGLDWKPKGEGRMAIRLGTFDFARWSKDGFNLNSLKIGTGIVF